MKKHYELVGYYSDINDIQRYVAIGWWKSGTAQCIIEDMLSNQGAFYQEADGWLYDLDYFQEFKHTVSYYEDYIIVWDIQDDIQHLDPDIDFDKCNSFIDIYKLTSTEPV